MAEQILGESGVVTGYEDDVIPDPSLEPEEYRAPVCIRKLSGKLDADTGEPTFENTGISGTFRSNDDRTDPLIAFITANRNADESGQLISHFYDGYGVAIMTTTAQGVADGKPNIFIVDSSLARKDVVLENVLHTGWGDYAYMAAITKEILPNINYHFKLIFRSNGALEFTIWEAGTAEPVPDITYGATSLLSAGEYWGVSLSDCQGHQVVWTALHLHNVDDSYAGHYYKIKATAFPDTFNVSLHGWGDLLNSAGVYGIRLFVMNFTSTPNGWDLLGHHTYGPGDIENCYMLVEGLSRAVYADADDYVHIMVLSDHQSDYDLASDSRINIDEVKLEAWSDDQVHVGGSGDVYIHETTGLEENYIDIENVDIQEWFNASNAKITGTLILPLVLIRGIELLDAVMQPTGVFLVPLVDWTFQVSEPDLRYSTRENNYFIFAAPGSNVRIHYYTYPTVLQAQEITEELSRQNAVYDLLIKCMTPYEVFIEADRVSDNMPYEDRDYLVSWINSPHHEELSLSGVAEALQEFEGVRDITVTRIRVLVHNQDGSVDEIIADPATDVTSISLTYPEIEAFVIIDDTDHVIFS